MRNKLLFAQYAGVLILCCLLLNGCAQINRPYETCTIFTAQQDDTVLFGNNEDWHEYEAVMNFNPASPGRYGSVGVGVISRNGVTNFNGRMNDQGLAWDVNSLPNSDIEPQPGKPFSHAEDNYLTVITQQAATVQEAINIARMFDFGGNMPFQIHIADATGDAVVIGPGKDGEIAFTRKPAGDGFLISTNFNLANPESGHHGWRYDTAEEELTAIMTGGVLDAESAGQVLDDVHLNMLTTYTIYSNVFDMSNKKIYLYYMAQYDEVVVLDLEEELSKSTGELVYMRDLFSEETTAAGDAAYQKFETRFRIAQVGVVFVGLLIITGVVVLVVRQSRKRLRSKQEISSQE